MACQGSISLTYLRTCIFYAHRSQKWKNSVKLLVSFCAFVIWTRKSLITMLVKTTAGVDVNKLLFACQSMFYCIQFIFSLTIVVKFWCNFSVILLANLDDMHKNCLWNWLQSRYKVIGPRQPLYSKKINTDIIFVKTSVRQI